MNDFIFFVNGIMAPPELISDGQKGTGADVGSYVRISMAADKFEGVKFIDALEVRASNVTKRYHWRRGDDNFKVAGDRVKIRCPGLDNTF